MGPAAGDRREDAPGRGPGGLTVLAFVSALWFLAKLLRYAFPPLFDTLRTGLGVGDATLGLAFSAMMLVYAATQFPSGAIADRLGPVRVVAVGGLLAAVGAAVVGTVPEGPAALIALVVGMVIFGVGSGAHKTVAVTLLAGTGRGSGASGGRALGIMDTFGTFGGVLAPLAVVWLLAPGRPGWRLLFLAGAAAAAVLGVGFWLTERRAGTGPREPSTADPRPPATAPVREGAAAGALRSSVAGYRATLSRPRVAIFLLVSVFFSIAYNGVVAFLPSYLAALPAVTTAEAGLVYGGFFLVSLVQPLSGAAADRWGAVPVVAASLGLATAGLLALLAVSGLLAAAAAALALGTGSHAFRPVRGAHLVALSPEGAAGGTLGVARTALMGAGALAPAAVGLLADAAGYRVAFLLPAIALGGAAAGAAWLLGTDGTDATAPLRGA